MDMGKLVKYEFHFDYMVAKYSEKFWLCGMDTHSFVYHTKMHDFYKDIAGDLERGFDTSDHINININIFIFEEKLKCSTIVYIKITY